MAGKHHEKGFKGGNGSSFKRLLQGYVQLLQVKKSHTCKNLGKKAFTSLSCNCLTCIYEVKYLIFRYVHIGYMYYI